jgi:hypothetical protein
VILPHDIVKGLGAPFTGYDLIGGGGHVGLKARDGRGSANLKRSRS